MKRFHLHLHVDDLTTNIDFHSRLFALAPTRLEPDYAKWMLAASPVNFAISTRGGGRAVDHFGIQAESAEALAILKPGAGAASLVQDNQGATARGQPVAKASATTDCCAPRVISTLHCC